ncbi:MAG: flagellar basal body protein FliL [Gammaproteobacteria bacterium]|nr:MAG: flagellar basal body protein FliL [Gammaproteobacteria bacterium]
MAEDKQEPGGELKPPGGKQGGGMGKFVMLGVGAVLVIAVSVGTSVFLVKSMVLPAATAQAGGHGEGEGEGHGEGEGEKQPAIYYAFDPPFVVNFQKPTGARYLQVAVEVLTHDPKVVEAIKQHTPLLRNNLLMLFSAQTYEGLSTLEGKQKLREATLAEIQKVLQEKIGEPGVEDVYFTSFVMQ